MNEQRLDPALPSADHHEGGFRPMVELIEANAAADAQKRGGELYGDFIEQVRLLMDRARMADPGDELSQHVITQLTKLNDELAGAAVDEWSLPNWTRNDLPSRGNLTLPPYEVDSADATGVHARIVFRPFHLGGNAAAHGGHIALGFDDLLGMAAALSSGSVTRTASLTVDYRAITPLDRDLKLHAWTERQEGRKVYVRATLHDGERLCAEAHGLFIVLKPGQQ